MASSIFQRHSEVGIMKRTCSALRIRAVPALSNLPRTESASTGTLLSPSVPSAPRTNSGPDSAQEAAGSSRLQLCQGLPKRCAEFGVSVVQQIANVAHTQPPLSFQGRIACHLLHPALL